MASAPVSDDDKPTPEAAATPTTMGGVIRAIARVDSQPTLAPGQVLELTYELIDRLGGGGMGVVFRARDHRLGRDVAIKVLRPSDGDDERLRKLFEREARATAQLLHPNIVTLHHVGEHAGYPYLVLELLTGEALSSRLARRGRLALADALPILDAVLGALEFAHVRGVLHRDLKPNNVFITGDERIKVLDLGVSLALGIEAGPATLGAGTPGYMAPEQRTGGVQDARTDVWAAALLLVECLVGRLPDDVPAAVRRLDVPAALRDELERALATVPANRHESAGELRRALAKANERIAPAAEPAIAQPAAPSVRPRRLAPIVSTAILAATLAALATYMLARPTRTAPPTPAELTGTWITGELGTLQLRVDADGTAYGVYDRREGVVVGRYEAGVLTGTWCEAPTRRAPAEAGPVRLGFVRGDARILADGTWIGARVDTPTLQLAERMQRHVSCP